MRAAASAARQPADVEACRLLHRDPLAAGPLVLVGDREDQVAELAEAAVGAELAAWRR